MKKNWLWAISLALVLATVGLCGCSGSASLGELPSSLDVKLNSQQEGVWVTGQGKATAVPDIATLSLGIEAQEASVAEAQTEATEAMNKVKDALIDNDVAEKDIQTQRFSIRQVTEWDRVKEEEVAVGYRVTNMVTAKIRDIDKADTIIAAVANAGGDLTRIDNIAFSVDDPSAYYDEARQKAMADAEAKAKHLAELAGVTLGKPTYISESIYMPSPIYPRAVYEETAVAAGAPPISPGEMEISLTVQVAYAVLD
ncbi:SIMPL domain-containing protein [Chloroflexota bacterium]